MQEKQQDQATQGLLLEDIIDEVRGGHTAADTGNSALEAMLRRKQVNFTPQEQKWHVQTAPLMHTAEDFAPDVLPFAPPEGTPSSAPDRPVMADAAFNPAPARISQEDLEMPQKKAKAKKRPPRRAVRAKKMMVALLGAAILVAGTAFGYTYLYPGIHLGVRAGAVSVDGLTVAEAQKEIDGAAEKLLSGKAITLSIYKTDYEIDIDSVTTGLDSAQSAQAAFDYTHTGNPFVRVGHAVSALFGGYEVPLSVSVNDEELTGRLDQIEAEALTEPVEPSWQLENDRLIIDAGKPGVGFDTDAVAARVTDKIRTMDFKAAEVKVTTRDPQPIDIAAIQGEAQADAQNAIVDKKDGRTIIPSVEGVKIDLESAKAIVGDGSAQTYEIPVTRIPAEITAEKLSEVLFRDTLASTSTSLNSSNKPRTNNVRLAAEHINGTILNPGDEFSYNVVVGERTAARGFRTAGAYANGRVIDEVGGGVCQPSSTMYMALLRADLAVTERHNHSLTVAYTPLGEDAAVSWGGPDLRFKNNTKYPIKVLASQSGSTMSITLKGTKVSDKKVTLKTEILTTLGFETIEKQDKTLAPGARTTSQTGSTGYKTVTYKTVTVNGESKTVKANNSSYKKKDKIVLVGPAAPQEPAPVPVPPVDPPVTAPQTGDPEATN